MSCKQEPAPNTKFLLSTGPKTKLLALNSKEYQTNKDKTLALCDNTTSSVFVFFDRDDETEGNQNNNDNDISPNIMELKNLANRDITSIASNLGSINVVTGNREFLSADTVVTEERNEEVNFNAPSIFDLYDVINASCGAEHTFVCGVQQQRSYIFCRGNNSNGQLGLGKKISYTDRFKQVHIETSPQFFQVACGSFFTLLLTTTGKVWGFGHNHHGQLGSGSREQIVWEPTEIGSLNGIPVTQIAAGTSHSLALSTTGLLFCAGSNSQGQLGISGQYDQNSFTNVESLSAVFVVRVSANGCYSAAIDEFGTLYIWGGAWGSSPRSVTVDCGGIEQSDANAEADETKAKEGENKELFVDVSLGADGRFAALTSRNKLIVGGFYVNGEQVLTPIEVASPRVPFTGIFSGGDFFVVVASRENRLPLKSIYFDTNKALLPPNPKKMRDRLRPPQRILTLSNTDFNKAIENPFFGKGAGMVFASLSSLNGSFLVANFNESMLTISSGIDIAGVIGFFDTIMRNDPPLMQRLTQVFNRTVMEVRDNPPEQKRPWMMRFLVIGLLHPSAIDMRESLDFWRNLVEAIDKMKGHQVLAQWLSATSRGSLSRVLKSVKDYISVECAETGRLYSPLMIKGVKAMEAVWFASNRTKKLPFDAFYHEQVNLMINIQTEHQLYASADDNWCYTKRSPWILDANTKTRFIRLNSRQMMNQRQINAMRHATQFWGDVPVVTPLDLFLILQVDRSNVVMDTFQQICLLKNPDLDLKKPLKVVFKNEPGVDEGGLQREFFQLIVAELLDPAKEVFTTVNNEFYWFNRKPIEPTTKQCFYLTGVVVGLAIYNGNLLNVRFPIVLYKKLRRMTVTIEDLKELDESVYNSLRSIESYGGNVEEDMGLFFEYDEVPLKKNGSSIAVTNENRGEFVRLVVDFILNKSIREQFESFEHGFMQSAGDIVLDLFRPEELSLLVAGREELDFIALQKATRYEGGFTKDSEPVRAFWHIVHTRLTDAQKKKLLVFVTSSPRAPINGLGAVPFVIAKDGNPEHIPTSHTCFFMLVLPDDPNEDSLYRKLIIAIENSEGFAFK